MSEITDPLGNTTSFEYDNQNRVKALHEPSQIPGQPPVSTNLTLDGEGRVLELTFST